MPSTMILADANGANTPGSGMICRSSSEQALYSGWIDSAGSIWIAKYDEAYQLTQVQKIDTLAADQHDTPFVLCMNPSGSSPGKVLAVYAEHAGAQYSKLSTAAGDIRQWGSRVEVTNSATAATFDFLYQANDTAHTVFLIYSQGNAGGNYTWGYKTTTNGTTWSTYVPILVPASATPIVRAAQDPANHNIIHWIICPDLLGVQYHAYMVVQSDGSVKWYKSDSTEITSTLGTGWTGYTNFTEVTSETCVSYDVNIYAGKPAFLYIVWATSGSDTHALHTAKLAKWTGSTWTTEVISRLDSAGTSESPSYAGPDYRFYPYATYSPGVCLDPNDINTCYLSIAFGSDFSPALPDIATSGTLTDVRIEKWVKSGTWAKSANISDTTATCNNVRAAFPEVTPTRLLYTSGAEGSFNSYLEGAWTYPSLTLRTGKESTPVWTPSRAPINTIAYYLGYENTGNVLHDVTGTHNGTGVGTLTWTTDGTYGPVVSGFSTDNYNRIDSLGTALSQTATWNPFWCALLFKNSDSTTSSHAAFAFSNYGTTSGQIVCYFNFNSTPGAVGLFIRDDSNSVDTFVGYSETALSYDGNWHVFQWNILTTTNVANYYDGVIDGTYTVGLSTTTLSQGTLGGYYTTSLVHPFQGTIGALLFGSGAGITIPDPLYVYNDLINGQFGGTRAAIPLASTGGSVLMMDF